MLRIEEDQWAVGDENDGLFNNNVNDGQNCGDDSSYLVSCLITEVVSDSSQNLFILRRPRTRGLSLRPRTAVLRSTK